MGCRRKAANQEVVEILEAYRWHCWCISVVIEKGNGLVMNELILPVLNILINTAALV